MMSGGQAIASYEGKDPVVVEAPMDGTYELYDTYLDRQPKMVVSLLKGSAIGFRASDTGVIAVGGRKSLPLPDGNYIWKIHK